MGVSLLLFISLYSDNEICMSHPFGGRRYSRSLRNFQGEVGLLVGSGENGATNSGTGTSASFNNPSAIAMDENAGAYIAVSPVLS